MSEQKATWGWCPETEEWVKLRLDADGSIHVVGYVDELGDIGDIELAGIADDDILFWDDTAGDWLPIPHLGVADAHHNRQHALDSAPDHTGTITDVQHGVRTLANAHAHGDLSGIGAGDHHASFTPADHTGIGDGAPHHAEAHDLASHTTKAHAELTGVGANDHHNEAHDLASHTTKAHAELTDVTAAQHHAKYTNGEAVSAVEAAGLALASGKNIKVIQALAADHTWSGLTAVMTAGTNLVRPQAVYVGGDGKMEKARADSALLMPAIALATGTIAEDAVGEFLMQGFFRDDTWTWTPGGLLYVDENTGGDLTQILPAGSGEQVQVVGVAITADIIYFNPSYELVEVS